MSKFGREIIPVTVEGLEKALGENTLSGLNFLEAEYESRKGELVFSGGHVFLGNRSLNTEGYVHVFYERRNGKKVCLRYKLVEGGGRRL